MTRCQSERCSWNRRRTRSPRPVSARNRTRPRVKVRRHPGTGVPRFTLMRSRIVLALSGVPYRRTASAKHSSASSISMRNPS